jgi:hypothetical protein
MPIDREHKHKTRSQMMTKPSEEFWEWAYVVFAENWRNDEFDGDGKALGYVDFMWLAYLKGQEDRPVEKVFNKYRRNGDIYGYCEGCGELNLQLYNDMFCGNCGAKLDWSNDG